MICLKQPKPASGFVKMVSKSFDLHLEFVELKRLVPSLKTTSWPQHETLIIPIFMPLVPLTALRDLSIPTFFQGSDVEAAGTES